VRKPTTEDTEDTEEFTSRAKPGSAVDRMTRWMKFNAVGAMGMGVQLAALAVFNRWMAGHYLVATAAALEVTLLHNFVWHVLYTWRDRRDEGGVFGPMVRFHLSNGAVSMVGNLVLMRVLVEGAGMPVLASNGAAILVCSVANFFLGDGWVFAKMSATVGPDLKRETRSPQTGWTT
jgi:putative flippase GtrA